MASKARRNLTRSPPLAVLVAMPLAMCVGCSPHYYQGEVAILDKSPAIVVTQTSSDWGDCYRRFGRVPTVYRISRPDYVLDIVHGQRYWAEFLFVAHDKSGVELGLSGPDVMPVRYRSGGDMRRLRESRGVLPGFETVKLDASSKSLTLTIKDQAGQVVGTESLSFKVEAVTCFELDAV